MHQRTVAYVVAASILTLLTACNNKPEPTQAAEDATYQANIRWTSYGIPHVKADDWGSLGYGFAYAKKHATD